MKTNKRLSDFARTVLMIFHSMLFLSCQLGNIMEENAEKSSNIKVACWNVQTFFDATTDGNEYSEFKKSSTWGKDAYKGRLKKLCSSIKSIDADVFVMEEIENENVLQDINNFLAGEWNLKKTYPYACFAKDEGSSIGCAVISRVPLKDLTVHSLDIRSEDAEMPSMRPIMQLTVCAKEEIILLVNHWKSKSGGEATTEIWRDRQEGLLQKTVESIESSSKHILIVGDFNRDIHDFYRPKKDSGQILLRKWVDGKLIKDGTLVNSAWYSGGNEIIEPGSYYYNGEWSRIDNVFTAGKLKLKSFYPETDGPWCSSSTFIPQKYIIRTESGYSDHLPLFCIVSF